MWHVILISVVLIFLVVGIHFFALNVASGFLQGNRVAAKHHVMAAIYLIIFTHIAEVVLFAVGYYIGVEVAGIGELKGEFGGDFREYIYFSLVSYTSLGLGDVYPYGPIRLLTGVEALTGLIMIGWSATFTYLVVNRIWDNRNTLR